MNLRLFSERLQTEAKMRMSNDRALLRVGIFGAAGAALCAFTFLPVLTLTTLDLGEAVGWLNYVLLPTLVVFVGVIIYALVRSNRRVFEQPRSSSGR